MEFSRYFNDLAATPDELHGQALTTLKNRLCGSYPAMTFVAIARCLAKAYVLFKMVARGGQDGRIAVLHDGTN